MEKTLNEKREKLGNAWEEYKSFRDSLSDDQSAWTAEDREKFDKLDAEVDKLEDEIRSLEEKITRSKKDKDREARFSQTDADDDINGVNTPAGGEDEKRVSAIFDRYLTDGARALTSEERDLFESRAMQAGADVSGGYLITPEKFVKTLLKDVDDVVKIRQLATVHQLKSAASLGIVKLDNDLDDWEWTTELETGSDDDMEFGKRSMTPNPMAKRVKISETLIRKSSINVQTLVRQRMSYKQGGTMEANYMVGDGNKKPLGLFVASNDGIPTSRDVATDNTPTLLKADNLISVQGALKEAYQNNARWLFHRDAVTKIRKLKDNNGQYLFVPGIQKGAANMILEKRYVLSEWCPNTFAANKYVGMYGDFKYYWIIDALNMAIKVLHELYAETNQIGYIGRYEGDGQPVLAEAFVRIKMGE